MTPQPEQHLLATQELVSGARLLGRVDDVLETYHATPQLDELAAVMRLEVQRVQLFLAEVALLLSKRATPRDAVAFALSGEQVPMAALFADPLDGCQSSNDLSDSGRQSH
jgi:hypothetical protein